MSCGPSRYLNTYLDFNIFYFRLKGIISLDIDISNLEINQCEVDADVGNENQIFSFHGTHKCPNETTYVSRVFI